MRAIIQPLILLALVWVGVAWVFTGAFNAVASEHIEHTLTLRETMTLFSMIITARFLAAPLAFIMGFGSPEQAEEIQEQLERKQDSADSGNKQE